MFSYCSSAISRAWHGEGKWHGYKTTSILLLASLAETLNEFSWILLDVDMVGVSAKNQAGSEAVTLIFAILYKGLKYGGIGLACDYGRSIYNETVDTSRARMAPSPTAQYT